MSIAVYSVVKIVHHNAYRIEIGQIHTILKL